MLDHTGFGVTDFDRSLNFYVKALAPLGITVLMQVSAEQSAAGSRHAGLGKDGKPFFWIGEGAAIGSGLHVAFVAADRAQVDAFHAAAMAAGATDNGAPGLRPHYHPNYYGAFVRDPDGVNIEAVCHTPQ